jgi:hypothetical protein
MGPRVPRKLTLALAGLMAVQAVVGLTASDHYRDIARIKATWFGNDWLTLVVAVPLLLVSGIGGPSADRLAHSCCGPVRSVTHLQLRVFICWAPL